MPIRIYKYRCQNINDQSFCILYMLIIVLKFFIILLLSNEKEHV